MDGGASLLLGLSALTTGIGGYVGNQQQAAQAKTQAQVGRIQADQIDAGYREELTSTINNIRAIRAATGVAPDSPTTQAIEAENTKISDRNRTRDVANRQIQANQSEQDAKFFKSAGAVSLFGGTAKSLPYFFGKG